LRELHEDLKHEEIYIGQYQDIDDLRVNITECVEQYYNRQRLHSALGYQLCAIQSATKPIQFGQIYSMPPRLNE
jgi:hypothetical protein